MLCPRFARHTVDAMAMEPVVGYLGESNSRVLISDKEGFFAVMPRSIYMDKGRAAVHKNFIGVLDKPSRIHNQAISAA